MIQTTGNVSVVTFINLYKSALLNKPTPKNVKNALPALQRSTAAPLTTNRYSLSSFIKAEGWNLLSIENVVPFTCQYYFESKFVFLRSLYK